MKTNDDLKITIMCALIKGTGNPQIPIIEAREAGDNWFAIKGTLGEISICASKNLN